MIGDGGFAGGILALFDRRLETADTFPDSLAEFGKFLRAEHEQGNCEDYQQMRGLQESFEHKFPLTLIVTKHRSLRIAGAAPVLGSSTSLSLGRQRRATAAGSPVFPPE